MMPSMLLPFCIFPATVAAISIVTEAFTHSPATSGRCFSVGPLRRRMRHDDDADVHHRPTPPSRSKKLLSLLSSSGNNSTDDEVGKPKLLVKNEIAILESEFQHMSDPCNNDTFSSLSRFEPLLGLYEVKSVITSNPKENPVGGKWTRSNGVVQKYFTTRSAFQHLLPFNATGQSLSSSLSSSSSSASSSSPPPSLLSPVAEAVNVVSLDAFNGTFRITIVLRGDVVPLSSGERQERNTMNQTSPTSITVPIQLSNLAVRAYFDPPRIYFGKRRRCNRWKEEERGSTGASCGGGALGSNEYSYFPLQLGPVSSVILDTTYYDKEVRIGMGGTSGTRFVFASTNKEEANEYQALLKIPYVKKYKVATMLGLLLAASLNVAFPDMLGRSFTSRLMSKAAAILASPPGTVPLASSMARSPLRLGMRLFRLAGGTISVFSAMALIAILVSSGGIERRRMND